MDSVEGKTAYNRRLAQCKKPTYIQAHLVFADTQSPNKKPKELEFCQRSTEKHRN